MARQRSANNFCSEPKGIILPRGHVAWDKPMDIVLTDSFATWKKRKKYLLFHAPFKEIVAHFFCPVGRYLKFLLYLCRKDVINAMTGTEKSSRIMNNE